MAPAVGVDAVDGVAVDAIQRLGLETFEPAEDYDYSNISSFEYIKSPNDIRDGKLQRCRGLLVLSVPSVGSLRSSTRVLRSIPANLEISFPFPKARRVCILPN